MKLYEYSDFKIVKNLKANGLAGGAFLITNGTEKFVLKDRRINQGLNEVIVQKLFETIGFPSIQVEWIHKDIVYGMIKYEENLNRIVSKSFSEFSINHLKQYISRVLISYLLNNDDLLGQQYLRNDEVISLDYGDTLLSDFEVENIDKFVKIEGYSQYFLNDFNEEPFYLRFSSARKMLNKMFCNYFDSKQIDDIVEDTMKKIANLDLSKMESTLDDIAKYVSPNVANLYAELLYRIKTMCNF